MSDSGTVGDTPGTTRRLPVVQPPAPTADERPAARARRFWSGRRVPAALTALVVFGAAGALLYDIAAVRAHRTAMVWRVRLADELATRPLEDRWVVIGAAVAALAGLWLIVLALTPGERQVLPMRRGVTGARAGLDRHAAGLVLRDRAMEVSGVRWVRVAVGRRRIKARVGAHFRELDEVRADVDAVLEDTVRRLGLARPPRLVLHVVRAERK